MYFRYGNFVHPQGEVAFEGMSSNAIRSPRNQPLVIRKTLACSLEIVGADQVAINNRLILLQQAYASEGKAHIAGFYLDNGQRTQIEINGNQSETGLIVSSFPTPQAVDGSDFSTHLKVGFTITADFVPFNAAELVDYGESLSFEGTAGPRTVWQVTDTGEPRQWTLAQKTTQKVVQSGFAVGRTGYPTANARKYSDVFLNAESAGTSYDTPQLNGAAYRLYRVNWQYRYEAGAASSGLPLIR